MSRLLGSGWAPAIAALLIACGSLDGERFPERNKTNTPSTPGTTSEDPPRPPEQTSCENGSLSFGPATLPPAVLGERYDVDLHTYAEQGWWGVEYDGPSEPPDGLELGYEGARSSLDLHGIPTKAGKYSFTVTAIHGVSSNGCSTMPDPHSFELEVLETAPADAGADEGPKPPK